MCVCVCVFVCACVCERERKRKRERKTERKTERKRERKREICQSHIRCPKETFHCPIKSSQKVVCLVLNPIVFFGDKWNIFMGRQNTFFGIPDMSLALFVEFKTYFFF